MRLPRSAATYVTAAATLAVIGASTVGYAAETKTVTVNDNGQRKVFRGFATGTIAQFLTKQGFSVKEHDRVTPDLTSHLQSGMVVDIQTPTEIQVDVGGQFRTVYTFAGNISDMLQEANITLSPDEFVLQPLTTHLTNGEHITIDSHRERTTATTKEIPFQTIRQRTDQLVSGQERVLTYGVKGLLEVQTTTVFVNGHSVQQKVHKVVKKKPVNQVVEIGTGTLPTQLVSRGFNPGMISGELTVLATAYVAGGVTASGLPAEPGVIAVDPSVIPLGTKLYVPGVGVVVAADTGGAIIGRRIDVCVSSQAVADTFGEKTLSIYVLK